MVPDYLVQERDDKVDYHRPQHYVHALTYQGPFFLIDLFSGQEKYSLLFIDVLFNHFGSGRREFTRKIQYFLHQMLREANDDEADLN